jgi:iron complex outermembrane receptor protein
MNLPPRARRFAAPLAIGSLASVLAPTAYAQNNHDSLEEIIVTGVPRDRSAGALAQSITVVGGDELDRVRASTLGETLANQLGVSSSYFGAGASRPIIRGLAGARVQMLEDGIDTMDAATVSDDHAVTVEPLAAEQIEIFRGPTTLLYGSGAIGGVVNTVTTRVPTRAPEHGFEGAAELRGDSVANARGAAVRFDGGAARFAWHFDAGRRDSKDYEIPGFAHAGVDPANPDPDDVFGVVENSAAESESAAFGVSWLGDRGFIGIGLNAFDTLYGVPGHEHEAVPPPGPQPAEEEAARIDLERRRVDLRGGWEGLEGAIEGVNVRIGLNDYEHVELEGDAVGTRFTNDATEVRVELLHRAAGRLSGAFGMHVGEREFAAIAEEAFVPPVDGKSLGVFVVEDVDLALWQLSLGGRLESVEHEPSNGLPAFDEHAKSLSFGGVRQLAEDYAFVGTLALSERLPVAEELYSDGPHLATGVVQIGDPFLGKESARHLDLGIRRQAERVDWSVTAFHTRYDDFIYLADTGAVDPLEELPVFVYRQADADFHGVEAEVFLPLLEQGPNAFDLRLFADHVRGELKTRERLPRLPPLRYGARFEYHNDRLLVGLEATHHDDQTDVAPFETATDGYTLLNADVRWRLGVGAGTELELFANATNLGDELARKHTSFVKDVAPLPGRNYTIGLRTRF